MGRAESIELGLGRIRRRFESRSSPTTRLSDELESARERSLLSKAAMPCCSTNPSMPQPPTTNTQAVIMPPHRSYVQKLSPRANWLLTGAVALKCVTLIIYLTGVGRRSTLCSCVCPWCLLARCRLAPADPLICPINPITHERRLGHLRDRLRQRAHPVQGWVGPYIPTRPCRPTIAHHPPLIHHPTPSIHT